MEKEQDMQKPAPAAASIAATGKAPAQHASPFQAAIAQCWTCRTECTKTFFAHCLEEGGPHLEKSHVAVLNDCIQICQAAADSMLRESPVHAQICAACASVCDALAESCDSMDTAPMRALAATARACAHACRDVGSGEKDSLAGQFMHAETGDSAPV